MIQKDDLVYIDEVLQGNTSAFTILVDRHKDMVYTIAKALLRDSHEAEEAAQDSFVKAFQSLKSFRRKARFSTWLYRIIYNECVSRLRKRKIHTVSLEEHTGLEDPGSEGHEMEELTDTEAQRLLLERALGTLNEVDRSVILFYYYEDLSVEEIAKITSLTQSNVKIKLFRARKKLYEELQPVFQTPYSLKITS